jgi:HSP20 family protein
MNTLFPPTLLDHRRTPLAVDFSAASPDTRRPHYECIAEGESLLLTLYLPDVEAAGVEIVVRGPDLIVIGRKRHFVRVNFAAANLEAAQLDYELRLRLGHDLAYAALHAELVEGVLTLRIPRRVALSAAA